MKTILKLVFVIFLILLIVWAIDLIGDKNALQDSLIRLHVVASSDSTDDQTVKLQVRDAITAYLQPIMEELPGKTEALAYICAHLADLEAVANQALQAAGSEDLAVVTLAREIFDTRHYDTFSLPAGVYDSLRVTIGEGAGHNWWCVVFPSLCLPATTEDFQNTAASSGFDADLTQTLSGTEGYEVRFFLLDCLGWLENFFHRT